jgi:hypothetical protein
MRMPATLRETRVQYWTAEHRLTRSRKTATVRNLLGLTGGIDTRWDAPTGGDRYARFDTRWEIFPSERRRFPAAEHLFDHCSLWNRSGRPAVLVCEPYWTPRDEVPAAQGEYLRYLAEQYDVRVVIGDARESWHCPGETAHVEIWRSGT